ncbi:MAG TPA: hypothetical protein VFC68_01230, partial [Treponemataceae bacterium]|nr:hypothetical protein [Treponemataceae bacterium]
LLTEYRNYLSLFENFHNMLTKKGLIQDDPYKKDKKITDIFVPDESDFSDSDKAMVMGVRLSEYETSLDYLCNYFKFSIANLSLDRLKTLAKLSSYIKWQSLKSNSVHPNTRALSGICTSIRNGSDQMAIKILNDFITVARKNISNINKTLKDLVELKKIAYKATVRKTITEHPTYSSETAQNSPQEFERQIKKLFPTVMGKTPYYKELIEELVKEEFAPNKQEIYTQLLETLRIKVQQTVKKTKKLNTKELLMDSIRTLASITPQLEQIIKKISENHTLLDNEDKNFWRRFQEMLRKAFNIEPPRIEYKLEIEDPHTHLKRTKTLNYFVFMTSLSKRNTVYSSFAIKNTPGYMKLETQSEKKILEFINTQLKECKQTIVVLESLNIFFKTAVRPINRERLANWAIELTSIQNTLIKTAQRKAEYTSYIEEHEQLKKLGIIDE